jgi:hypothetical protein
VDLSILQKVSEMVSEGKDATEIKQELQVSGVAPETADQALKEAGVALSQTPAQVPQTAAPAVMHHEKVIQPTPGFDPNAK